MGLAHSAVTYIRANRARLRFRDEVAPLLAAHDALLTPTAPSTAPAGLGSTGDPVHCEPWSWSGVPSISLPSSVGSTGLPHAIQLVARAHGEAALDVCRRSSEAWLDFRAFEERADAIINRSSLAFARDTALAQRIVRHVQTETRGG